MSQHDPFPQLIRIEPRTGLADATPITTPPQAREIEMEWSSGETFAIPYEELRFACPCAFCVDEHTGVRRLKREQIRPGVRPLKVTPTGRYALRLNWSDGHGSGLYTFEHLYSLCKSIGQAFPVKSG